MARGHAGLPRASKTILSRAWILAQLKGMDEAPPARARILSMETDFRLKIDSHVGTLPAEDAVFAKFSTSPFVLLIRAREKNYTKVSQLEADILPAKEFSSMETSAGRMVEEVVLPVYGWQRVASKMHTPNSALDGRKNDVGVTRVATLKSGPRCLNDEMSENFADAVLEHCEHWAGEAGVSRVDFTYGVLYGTPKQSNKKDWHILRNIRDKSGANLTSSPNGKWDCAFLSNEVSVDVTVRIGLDWWRHLGGESCFLEVITALIRACVAPGSADGLAHTYTIADLGAIVSTEVVPADYNVSLLQRSQLPWLFLMARHFCDELSA